MFKTLLAASAASAIAFAAQGVFAEPAPSQKARDVGENAASGTTSNSDAVRSSERGTQNRSAQQNQDRRRDRTTASDRSNTNSRQEGREGQQTGHASANQNAMFATWLAQANHAEVELAKLAQQRAQHEEVKKFAQQMVKDHSQFLAKLEQAGAQRWQSTTEGNRSQPSFARSGDTQQDRTRGNDGQQTRARASIDPAVRGNQSHNLQQLTSIKQEIAEQCLQNVKQELSQKEGAEFDKAYIGVQVGKHLEMLSALQVLERHTSGEFAQLVSQGIETTQQHLQHAKSICEKLESHSSNN